jgi:threonine dehydrogenase-like Zn-dependent dehydrogenase
VGATLIHGAGDIRVEQVPDAALQQSTDAERIILMGRHQDRTDLGREFGATDVVAERGAEGVERVRELTGGDGTHTVLECVALLPAVETAFGVARNGGVAVVTVSPERNGDVVVVGLTRVAAIEAVVATQRHAQLPRVGPSRA